MLRNPEVTIGNLIDKQRLAYVGTITQEGFPAVRAMFAPRKREGIRTLYFTTNLSSRHVNQVLSEPKGCVYFCDTRFYRGVMLYGHFEALGDEASRREIWRDGDETYYPAGVNDPDYCVLKFTAIGGRYYSDFHSQDFPVE